MKGFPPILILLVASFMSVGCRDTYRRSLLTDAGSQRSWQIGAGSHVATDKISAGEFEGLLQIWLKNNGFVEVRDPGGLNSWAGVHSAGEVSRWYQSDSDKTAIFLIQFSVMTQPNARDGWTLFSFSHSWKVRGTKDKLDEAEKRSNEIAKNFITLVQETKKPNKVEITPPKEPSD